MDTSSSPNHDLDTLEPVIEDFDATSSTLGFDQSSESSREDGMMPELDSSSETEQALRQHTRRKKTRNTVKHQSENDQEQDTQIIDSFNDDDFALSLPLCEPSMFSVSQPNIANLTSLSEKVLSIRPEKSNQPFDRESLETTIALFEDSGNTSKSSISQVEKSTSHIHLASSTKDNYVGAGSRTNLTSQPLTQDLLIDSLELSEQQSFDIDSEFSSQGFQNHDVGNSLMNLSSQASLSSLGVVLQNQMSKLHSAFNSSVILGGKVVKSQEGFSDENNRGQGEEKDEKEKKGQWSTTPTYFSKNGKDDTTKYGLKKPQSGLDITSSTYFSGLSNQTSNIRHKDATGTTKSQVSPILSLPVSQQLDFGGNILSPTSTHASPRTRSGPRSTSALGSRTPKPGDNGPRTPKSGSLRTDRKEFLDILAISPLKKTLNNSPVVVTTSSAPSSSYEQLMASMKPRSLISQTNSVSSSAGKTAASAAQTPITSHYTPGSTLNTGPVQFEWKHPSSSSINSQTTTVGSSTKPSLTPSLMALNSLFASRGSSLNETPSNDSNASLHSSSSSFAMPKTANSSFVVPKSQTTNVKPTLKNRDVKMSQTHAQSPTDSSTPTIGPAHVGAAFNTRSSVPPLASFSGTSSLSGTSNHFAYPSSTSSLNPLHGAISFPTAGISLGSTSSTPLSSLNPMFSSFSLNNQCNSLTMMQSAMSPAATTLGVSLSNAAELTSHTSLSTRNGTGNEVGNETGNGTGNVGNHLESTFSNLKSMVSPPSESNNPVNSTLLHLMAFPSMQSQSQTLSEPSSQSGSVIGILMTQNATDTPAASSVLSSNALSIAAEATVKKEELSGLTHSISNSTKAPVSFPFIQSRKGIPIKSGTGTSSESPSGSSSFSSTDDPTNERLTTSASSLLDTRTGSFIWTPSSYTSVPDGPSTLSSSSYVSDASNIMEDSDVASLEPVIDLDDITMNIETSIKTETIETFNNEANSDKNTKERELDESALNARHENTSNTIKRGSTRNIKSNQIVSTNLPPSASNSRGGSSYAPGSGYGLGPGTDTSTTDSQTLESLSTFFAIGPFFNSRNSQNASLSLQATHLGVSNSLGTEIVLGATSEDTSLSSNGSNASRNSKSSDELGSFAANQSTLTPIFSEENTKASLAAFGNSQLLTTQGFSQNEAGSGADSLSLLTTAVAQAANSAGTTNASLGQLGTLAGLSGLSTFFSNSSTANTTSSSSSSSSLHLPSHLISSDQGTSDSSGTSTEQMISRNSSTFNSKYLSLNTNVSKNSGSPETPSGGLHADPFSQSSLNLRALVKLSEGLNGSAGGLSIPTNSSNPSGAISTTNAQLAQLIQLHMASSNNRSTQGGSISNDISQLIAQISPSGNMAFTNASSPTSSNNANNMALNNSQFLSCLNLFKSSPKNAQISLPTQPQSHHTGNISGNVSSPSVSMPNVPYFPPNVTIEHLNRLAGNHKRSQAELESQFDFMIPSNAARKRVKMEIEQAQEQDEMAFYDNSSIPSHIRALQQQMMFQHQKQQLYQTNAGIRSGQFSNFDPVVLGPNDAQQFQQLHYQQRFGDQSWAGSEETSPIHDNTTDSGNTTGRKNTRQRASTKIRLPSVDTGASATLSKGRKARSNVYTSSISNGENIAQTVSESYSDVKTGNQAQPTVQTSTRGGRSGRGRGGSTASRTIVSSGLNGTSSANSDNGKSEISVRDSNSTSSSTATSAAPGRVPRSKPVCNMCQKTFRDRYYLDRHMVTHTGIKAFKCSFCRMSFTQEGHLSRHIRTLHAREIVDNPMNCTSSECDASFAMTSADLSERMLTCPSCHGDCLTHSMLLEFNTKMATNAPSRTSSDGSAAGSRSGDNTSSGQTTATNSTLTTPNTSRNVPFDVLNFSGQNEKKDTVDTMLLPHTVSLNLAGSEDPSRTSSLFTTPVATSNLPHDFINLQRQIRSQSNAVSNIVHEEPATTVNSNTNTSGTGATSQLIGVPHTTITPVPNSLSSLFTSAMPNQRHGEDRSGSI